MSYNKEEQGLYRSMFLLSAHYMRQGLDKKIIIEKVLEWYNALPKSMRIAGARTVNKAKIIYTIKRTNGTAGCNYAITMLEDCGALKVCNGCPYF